MKKSSRDAVAERLRIARHLVSLSRIEERRSRRQLAAVHSNYTRMISQGVSPDRCVNLLPFALERQV